MTRFWILLLLAIFEGGALFWVGEGFSLREIRAPLLAQPDPIQAEIAWPTRFRYLGRGKQMFAFESEDQKLVLKFFNIHTTMLPWYSRFASKKWLRRHCEQTRIYPESYRLAFEELAPETGLLQVHLGSTERTYPTVVLRDPLTREMKIDLNQIPFVLQLKAEESFLERLEKDSDPEPLIEQYLAIHKKRIEKGIADYERHIENNYRCNGDRLLYIDPGRLFRDSRLSQEERKSCEWEKATYELCRSLVELGLVRRAQEIEADL